MQEVRKCVCLMSIHVVQLAQVSLVQHIYAVKGTVDSVEIYYLHILQ